MTGARKETARQLYKAAVMQARAPIFYREYDVPDTMDGRFEMTAMHVFLIMRALGPENKKLSQALFDIMFKNMEMACREMGIGDLSVPKHIKRMMKAYNGRAVSYQRALEASGLVEAVARNVYGTVQSPDADKAKALAYYMRVNDKALAVQDVAGGHIAFAALEDSSEQEAA